MSDDVAKLLYCELAREAMDSIGVDAALVNTRPDLLEYFIERYPDRFGGCPSIDHKMPDLDAFLAGLRSRPGMLAIRLSIMQWADGSVRPEFTEGLLEPVFSTAAKHNVPVCLAAMGVTRVIGPVAARHPDLLLIVDHLGTTTPPPMALVSDDHWKTLPDILALAKYPNIAMKFSGATVLSSTPYPHPDLWEPLHRIIDAFGPERLMWGSDFTRLRMKRGSTEFAPRAEWTTVYSNELNYLRDTTELSQSDKEAILGGTIRKLLRWANIRVTARTTASPTH